MVLFSHFSSLSIFLPGILLIFSYIIKQWHVLLTWHYDVVTPALVMYDDIPELTLLVLEIHSGEHTFF